MRSKNNATKRRFNYSPFILAVASVTLVFCIYNFMQLNKRKVACIDSAKVVSAYHGVEELNKKMEEKKKQFQAQLDTLTNDFQKSIKEYEKNRAHLSDKEAKAEEQKIRKKQNDYAQFNSVNEEKLKQEQMKQLTKMLETINAKIARYAKAQGYAAVFGATSTGAVVYMNDYVDITQDLIAVIND